MEVLLLKKEIFYPGLRCFSSIFNFFIFKYLNFFPLHVNHCVFLAHRAAACADSGSDEHTPDLRVLQCPGTQNGLQRSRQQF